MLVFYSNEYSTRFENLHVLEHVREYEYEHEHEHEPSGVFHLSGTAQAVRCLTLAARREPSGVSTLAVRRKPSGIIHLSGTAQAVRCLHVSGTAQAVRYHPP